MVTNPDAAHHQTEQAIEHLRMTIITARAVDATQSIIMINDLAAALDELDRLRTHTEELTDRVIADIHHKSDAEDARRELAAMRREWASVPDTETAVAKFRDRMREWFPNFEVGAATVAMPAATAMKLLTALDEWRTQVDTLLAREAEHAQAHDA